MTILEIGPPSNIRLIEASRRLIIMSATGRRPAVTSARSIERSPVQEQVSFQGTRHTREESTSKTNRIIGECSRKTDCNIGKQAKTDRNVGASTFPS